MILGVRCWEHISRKDLLVSQMATKVEFQPEGARMFARLTTIQGSADKIADAIRVVENDLIPGAKTLDGFKNGYWCADRKTGKMVALTMFETEAELQASEAAASQLRKTSTDKLGFEVKNVERYEVIAHV